MNDDGSLLLQALQVRKNAYCPYSGYAVGAALLGKSGTVYTGCNLENAALSVICAERAALAQAVSRGEREFVAVAVAGGPADGPAAAECWPCGVCRQMLFEFGGEALRVISGSPDAPIVCTLAQLLPRAFGPADVQEAE